MYVFLAGDLGSDSRWAKKIAAGGEESEEVRVDKACLEGQSGLSSLKL